MDRVILHCDMNGFFASVELLAHPELKNVPMAVCGNPENRHGIILAKNEPAKKAGVVTAQTLWQARKKCPELEVVPPHHDKYKHYSKLINEIYSRFTDMVEPFSIDESWLDVTASKKLFGDGPHIADIIRNTVKNELGLTLSAGVSFNKIFAKMGSEYKKPDATTVISRENYKRILWPLPVSQMFFVGNATTCKLNSAGIMTIGQLAQTDRNLLESMLGKHGCMLYDYANGLDDSPVRKQCEKEKIKSVGNGITFKRNLMGVEDIKTAVMSLSDTVAARLRHYEMKANGIKVDIKDTELRTISRQKQLTAPTNLAYEISTIAVEIISTSWNLKNPIRMLTITGINLCDEDTEEQLCLFGSDTVTREKNENLERAMDSIRSKFGQTAITFGKFTTDELGINPYDKDE